MSGGLPGWLDAPEKASGDPTWHLGERLQAEREDLRKGNALVQSPDFVCDPPYITVKDKTRNAAYRVRYRTCKGRYSLGVPFTELLFGLAHRGDDEQQQPTQTALELDGVPA